MAVYDINNNSLSALYDAIGTSRSSAYDINGNLMWSKRVEPTSLKVMTYNVQRFRGINSQQAMQNAIISKYNADFIGLQEIGALTMPTVGANMLADYFDKKIANGSNVSNPVGIVSKNMSFTNVNTVKFEHQDPLDQSSWDEERAYIKGTIVVDGKTITFVSAHLSYLTTSIKYQQMAELFAFAEQCDHVIITGDFNSMEMSEQSDDYISMYKPFVDAGYNLANNSPTAGFTNTYTNQSNASSTDDLQTAPDTIIVSGNIGIDKVVFDTTKFSYLNGSEIDHIPLIATLSVE